MDFAELTSRVRVKKNIDVSPLLAQYRQQTQNATPEGFLTYLRDQKVIDNKQLVELQTSGAVDLGSTLESGSAPYRATVYAGVSAHGTQIMNPMITRSAGTPKPLHGTLLIEPELPKRPNPNDVPTHFVEDTLLAPHDPGKPGSSAPPPAANAEAPDYEVLGELGKGAMGEVHLARDVVLRRKVALKSILPAMQQHPSLFSRFLAEMQITAQLDHPFIVPIYGVVTGPSGGLAYTMKLVSGKEFAELLEETREMQASGKPLDAAHALEARLEAFLKVCDALSYAHERGIVHRDLKPANIMLGPYNEVYVMDWGISRLMGAGGQAMDKGVEVLDADGSDVRQTTRTRVGTTIGTPIYMSPEQAHGKNDELDGRSDLYSLGLILQETLTLTRAVGGTTLEEVLTNAKGGKREPHNFSVGGSAVPQEIAAIVEKATRFNPVDRYPSVKAFADDIRRFLRNEELSAKPDTTTQRWGRWISKNRMTTIALLLGVLVLGAGATIGVLLYNRAVVAAQHNRELRLAELQASSAARTQELDATLQGYETQLTRFAGAAGLALTEVQQGDPALHFADEFKAGGLPGLIDSKVYGGLISLEWPVASLPAGLTKEMAARDAAAMNSLRTLARSVMLDSLDPNYRTFSDSQRQKAIAETGVPISRVALTLETGLHIEFPGNANVPADFDARQTDTYKAARTRYGVAWGAAMPGKNGMVLPASAALRDEEGGLIGVLEFEVDIERSVATSLEAGLEAGSHVESSLLVDKDGKVVAQRNAPGIAREPEVIGITVVRDAIARGDSGYVETTRNGRDVLVTYQPLSTMGWYMVTIADVDKVEDDMEPQGTATPGSVPASTVAVATASASPTPAKMLQRPAPAPAPTPSPAPVESESASASASESAPPVPAPTPSLTGRLPRPSGSVPAAPTTATPANPFDPWKAYEKKKQP
ncbi:MAG: protein kinase [Polyangiaceae bacterium]|nr:protein kinase [Polyangiaceae bacterium]